MDYFDIDKIKKLIDWKYYWLSIRKNVEAYIKGSHIYINFGAIRYKTYSNF